MSVVGSLVLSGVISMIRGGRCLMLSVMKVAYGPKSGKYNQNSEFTPYSQLIHISAGLTRARTFSKINF